MNANFLWRSAQGPDALADCLADTVAQRINACIADKNQAVIALSGGSTPKPLFKALAKRPLDWSKVVVTLVDERWVDESDALSNMGFLKTWFIEPLKVEPIVVPLYRAAHLNDKAKQQVLSQYCTATQSPIEQPCGFDLVILGMGEDGHTASFFPDADNIDELIDPDSKEYLQSCESPSTQVPRITWSLPVLLKSPLLLLHITGVSKKAVFEQAQQAGSVTDLPIRSMIFQDQTPLHVYYSD